MRSPSLRLLLSLCALIVAPSVFAHDVTISGTTSFAALDGSSLDHDGVANGVFGPSRTVLSTRLTDVALDGGTANQIGGQVAIRSTAFAEPAVVVGANANVVSQGDNSGAGPVTIEGCGIEVRGLVAALSRK